jgi:uncharacterized membrane protein YdjX (TVP38/TMEM64 family)
MLTERQRAWISAGILLVALVFVVVGVMASPLRDVFTSPERLHRIVHAYGPLGPVVMIGIHILQVVVAPIPGQAVDLANGYLFGWWLGAAVSLIGISLGSLIAIGLARRFGRPLVKLLITPKGMEKIRPYIRQRSQWVFFILFLLPGTPDDILCFAIGLTSIPIGRAIAIVLLGRAPGVLAGVLVGATGRGLNIVEFSVIAAAVSVLLGWLIWKTPLGKAMNVPKLPGTGTG